MNLLNQTILRTEKNEKINSQKAKKSDCILNIKNDKCLEKPCFNYKFKE